MSMANSVESSAPEAVLAIVILPNGWRIRMKSRERQIAGKKNVL
jgi:hypothetical protein